MGNVVQFDLPGNDGASHTSATRRLLRLIKRVWAKPASIDLFDDEPWSAVQRSTGHNSTVPKSTGQCHP